MSALAVDVVSFFGGCVLSAQHLGTNEEFVRWQTFRTQMLVWAFCGRPALIITESPLPSSWARWAADEYELSFSELKCESTTLLLLHVAMCSRELLEDAGVDEESARGLLWFSHPTSDVSMQACSILRARLMAGTNEKNLCLTGYEVLSCEADGRMIVWCSSNRDELDFDEWLSKIDPSLGLRIQKHL